MTEEAALLAQLGARLQAGSILAAGLLLTATQHDTCIAKLGLMQGVAVLAAASRYVSAIRRRAVIGGPTCGSCGGGGGGGSGSGNAGGGGTSSSGGDCGGGGGDQAQQQPDGAATPPSGAAVGLRLEDAAAGIWNELALRCPRLESAGASTDQRLEYSWATGPLSSSPPPAAPPSQPGPGRGPRRLEVQGIGPHPDGVTAQKDDPSAAAAVTTMMSVTGATCGGTPEGGVGGGRGSEGLAPAAVPAAAAAAVPVTPVGVWTSLRLDQLPRVAAHWVRMTAVRRALQRLGVPDTTAAAGAAAAASPVLVLDHASCCSDCRRWASAARAALTTVAVAAALAVAVALARLFRVGPWAAGPAGFDGGRAAIALVAGAAAYGHDEREPSPYAVRRVAAAPAHATSRPLRCQAAPHSPPRTTA
ncbi:hypothetical protein PLESTM_000344900 [Pleodorina starrii]|nr:hypothetical protein PLESTM_000344900 [Pleodorina starrii]